jgi:autotransporter-associated beta strand protein
MMPCCYPKTAGRSAAPNPRLPGGAGLRILMGLVVAGLLLPAPERLWAQQRVMGADISYWNNAISQANWNTAYSTGGRGFVFLRATRGGTTGRDQPQGTPGGGTNATLSHRYDDPRFVQNLIRATAAGMLVGPYHFAREDVSGNTGTDEANHFLQMAGAWMRPGYMMPMFDQEAGSGSDTLVQFALDFSDRIYAVMQIRPCIYINGSYSGTFQGATQARRDALAKPVAYTPSVVGPGYPMLWNAYYTTTLDIQTQNPKDGYSGFYGPWDDYGVAQPWSFWQYISTESIPGFNAADSTCDSDVSHGDLEYVRNYLVPAVWWNDLSGDWSTVTNWNCGQAPVAPVTPSDQAPPYATGGLPAARLPGAAGTGPTSGQYDTVILERPNANITVTLSTGSHNIRKLYQRETLNLTGGSLTINYDPTYRANTSTTVLHGGPISAQFSGPVTLSNSASLTAHTVQLDTNRVFTLAGGTLTFNTLNLMPHASYPARLLVAGDVALSPLANALAVIARGAGSGNSGYVDLGGGTRTLTVSDGTNAVDLSLEVPIYNGGVAKNGAGTLRLTATNTYAGGTTVSAGRLLVNNAGGSGTGSGSVTVNGGALGGTGTVAGAVLLNSAGTLAPGTPAAIGRLTLGSAPTLLGTNFLRVDRNGGATLADKLAVSSGTLTYGGTLVVSNVGAALVGGEVFTNFAAAAYAGAFTAMTLPALNDAGLNWYTGGLTNSGTLKVNRRPAAGLLTFTNVAATGLQIPLAALAAAAADPDGDALTVTGVSAASTNGIVLATDGTSIIYSNRASVSDQFSYTLSDGHGGSATGVASIVNLGGSPSASFAAVPGFSGPAVQLHFAGTPGWTYYLERSTNLVGWKTIWTNVAPAGGAFDYSDDFHDLGAPVAPAFYRLRWTP